MNWHIEVPLMEAYLSDALDGISASSVEQHLLRCPDCRVALAAAAPLPAADTDAIWLSIRDVVEVPQPTFIERLATRLGTSAAEARLLAAAPSLRPSWLAGVAAASMLAVLAAWFGNDDSIALFLCVAPLAPLAGVALAYGPGADPSHEIVTAAPYPSLRLMLLRAAAVLMTSIPIVAVAAILLPVQPWIAVGWLLPCLAFSLGALALSPRVPLTTFAATVGVLWPTAVLLAVVTRNPASVVAPAIQPVYLCLALLALGAILVRSRSAARPARSH